MLRGALETVGGAWRGHVPGTELSFGGSPMCCVLWVRGPRRRLARRDHGERHLTQAVRKKAGRVNAVLCGLRTSVFFVIREAMGGFSMRVRLTTPSHVARCARELSGAARRTRNRWWRLARPCARHRVEFRGFADVLRALGSRPAATFSPPRSRRKTPDASGWEGGWLSEEQGGNDPAIP